MMLRRQALAIGSALLGALTLGGWATTAGLACIYTVNKIVDPATDFQAQAAR